MRCLCSWMVLLGQEHRAVVEQIRIRVVSVDEQNLGNVSASWSALDLDYDVERISNVRLNGPVRKPNGALQNATGEPRESLLRGVRMNGGQRARMTRVQKLQEIESLAAPNLPEHDSVRAVAEGCLQ